MGLNYNELVFLNAKLNQEVIDLINNQNMNDIAKAKQLKEVFKKIDAIDILLRGYRKQEIYSEEKQNRGR